MNSLSQIIVALDVKTSKEALQIVDDIGNSIDFYKVGSVLYSEKGPYLLEELQKRGKRIFLDLKYHDIPNTVKEACYQSALKKVELITVHLSGGSKMLQAAMDGVKEATYPSKIIGVSVLTSMSEQELQKELRVSGSLEDHVQHLVKLGISSNISGIVCSPQETSSIRKLSKELIIVNPGIRLPSDEKGDQTRITTPKEALQKGASYLVIGRPITQAKNKQEKLKELLEHLNS